MVEGPVTAIEHVAIATRDATAAIARYSHLGFEAVRQEDVPGGIRSHILSSGDAYLEILEAVGEDSDLARYLERRGEGLHHVCLRVSALDDAAAAVEAAGCALVSAEPTIDARGRRVFVHPGANGGVLAGLVELHPEG